MAAATGSAARASASVVALATVWPREGAPAAPLGVFLTCTYAAVAVNTVKIAISCAALAAIVSPRLNRWRGAPRRVATSGGGALHTHHPA